MTAKTHEYVARIVWTGNRGQGTRNYRSYARNWSVETPGKPVIECSNDPLLGGDPGLHNPEDLLLASLSACHMLWYLHLASDAGIVVTAYGDEPLGQGEVEANGAGRFLSVTLRPKVTIAAPGDAEKARAFHWDIHTYCFIARSMNFPIHYEPETVVAPQ